jgi:hypothetical protein
MDHHTYHIYVLTRLFINPSGEVVSRNVGVTFDVFEAEAHRANVENDFEKYALSSDWREDAEQSSIVACMRDFRQIVEEMQDAALR